MPMKSTRYSSRRQMHESTSISGMPNASKVLGKEWSKHLNESEIWEYFLSKYSGKRKFSKKDVDEYANGLVKAAEFILKEKPSVVIAPLRGAFPLWKGISFALSEIKKRKYEEELKKLESRTDLTYADKLKEKKRLKKEILDYQPQVLMPPNTGRLRRSIVNYIRLHKGLSDLLREIESKDALSKTRILELAKAQPKLYHLVGSLLNEIASDADVLGKSGLSKLSRELRTIRKTTMPDFSKILLLDEVSGGGAIHANYKFLKKAVRDNGSDVLVLGLAETDRFGNYKLRSDYAHLLFDDKVKLIPIRKLVSMDNVRLMGITYFGKSNKGRRRGKPSVGYFDIDFGVQVSPNSTPTPPDYFGQHKWFLRYIQAKVKDIIKNGHDDTSGLKKFMHPTLRME